VCLLKEAAVVMLDELARYAEALRSLRPSQEPR
jgi:hypothetical protein